VALDKSEGAVKQKLSLAMPEHRDADRFTTNKSHREASVLNQLWWKTKRSTNHRFDPARGETMISLYEHPTSVLGAEHNCCA
jgi:hypothetical protein